NRATEEGILSLTVVSRQPRSPGRKEPAASSSWTAAGRVGLRPDVAHGNRVLNHTEVPFGPTVVVADRPAFSGGGGRRPWGGRRVRRRRQDGFGFGFRTGKESSGDGAHARQAASLGLNHAVAEFGDAEERCFVRGEIPPLDQDACTRRDEDVA